uniref:Uncharacterized protein n=1 Tax=Hyaloperonospora arabidopsidis (strain Emoy2) TaxID=559515 RepID=M4B6Q3_HYAAE
MQHLCARAILSFSTEVLNGPRYKPTNSTFFLLWNKRADRMASTTVPTSIDDTLRLDLPSPRLLLRNATQYGILSSRSL